MAPRGKGYLDKGVDAEGNKGYARVFHVLSKVGIALCKRLHSRKSAVLLIPSVAEDV